MNVDGLEHLDPTSTDPTLIQALLLRIASEQTSDAVAAYDVAERLADRLWGVLDLVDAGSISRWHTAALRVQLARARTSIQHLRTSSRFVDEKLTALKSHASNP